MKRYQMIDIRALAARLNVWFRMISGAKPSQHVGSEPRRSQDRSKWGYQQVGAQADGKAGIGSRISQNHGALLCKGFSPTQTQNMRIWYALGVSDIWQSVRQACLV